MVYAPVAYSTAAVSASVSTSIAALAPPGVIVIASDSIFVLKPIVLDSI